DGGAGGRTRDGSGRGEYEESDRWPVAERVGGGAGDEDRRGRERRVLAGGAECGVGVQGNLKDGANAVILSAAKDLGLEKCVDRFLPSECHRWLTITHTSSRADLACFM